VVEKVNERNHVNHFLNKHVEALLEEPFAEAFQNKLLLEFLNRVDRREPNLLLHFIFNLLAMLAQDGNYSAQNPIELCAFRDC
jgi:hypothetical protein